MENNTNVIGAFSDLADHYENNVDHNGPFNAYYERPAMMSLLPNPLSGMRVLDAGCAAGWYTSEFVRLGCDVTAIDLCPKMIEATKRRVGNQAKVYQHDLQEPLPFEDHSFDVILSSLALHYLKNWLPTFKEFTRILKTKGIFLYSVHHPFMDHHLGYAPNYFGTTLIKDEWKADHKKVKVSFYRRPLQCIFNDTNMFFTVEKILEPQPTKDFKRVDPDNYLHLLCNPDFLIMKCINK